MPSPSDTLVLARLTYGAGPEDERRQLRQAGLRQWLSEQLAAPAGDDPRCAERLARVRLRIRYPAGTAPDMEYPALDEERPLETLGASIDSLWPRLTDPRIRAYPERVRPRVEVAAACLVRAVYSRWQLREVLTDFWHNHFNVDASEIARIILALPVYDRDVIRRHALGNFRDFLEAVASSTAMLYYLNNQASRAGSPNENYARELFELHSFGREHYLNDLYDRWREVPGARRGQPVGFIDQDVYEAARAFTGWAVEDGSVLAGSDKLPASGRFIYVPSWHDNYQKRVLGTEFDPYQAPLADGRKLLDLIAAHPATARHLSARLCRRLVGDGASRRLVEASAELWRKYWKRPDQIARVVEFIVLSPEFGASAGARVRRPLELVAAFARASGMDFTPTEALINEMRGAGQRLFAWPAPTGHPEENDYWLSSNAMQRRWQLLAGLADNRWGNGSFAARSALEPDSRSFGQAADAWAARLLGAPPGSASVRTILAGLQIAPSRPLEASPADDRLLQRIATFTALSPEFQKA